MSKASLLREIEKNYTTTRKKWIKKEGSDKGFNTWFTKQVTKVKKK